MRRPVGVGRASVPAWTVGLALVVSALAAGQAVGPILSDAIAGSASLTVEQTVLLDTDFEIRDSSISAGLKPFPDFVSTHNDEGTHFTVGFETLNGSDSEFEIVLAEVDRPAAVELRLVIPPNLDIELDSDLGIQEAHQSERVWLFTIDERGGTLFVRVSPIDDSQLGFSTITGSLRQIAG